MAACQRRSAKPTRSVRNKFISAHASVRVIGKLEITIGTGADQVYRVGGAKPVVLARISRPTFLTRARGALFGVSEIGHGKIFRAGDEPISGTGGGIPIGGLDREPLETGLIGEPIPSGGAHPCHISVSPDERWLYVSNYGNGVVRAVELHDGCGFGEVIDLAHTGSGPDAMRQTGPHAHYAQVVDDWLVVADLGTDHLRVYDLDGGRPTGAVTLVHMPPGSGPRHFVRIADRLIVAGELDGSLTEMEIGTWRLGRRVPASNAPGAHVLSSILVAGDHLVVGVRGANTISVLTPDLKQVSEEKTVSWPRHVAHVVTNNGEGLVVAGERSNEIAWHDLDGGILGPTGETLRIPEPMFLGIGDKF